MSNRVLALLAAAALLVAACADGASPVTTTAGNTADGGSLAGDPAIVGCPGGPYFPIDALEEVRLFDEVGRPGLVDALQGFLAGGEGQFWPQEDWRLLHLTDATALVVHRDPVVGDVSFVEFEVRDATWEWAGASAGGPCPLEGTLPEGLGRVDWRIDPAFGEPSPDATSLPVLATELDCASGRPMGDRLLPPQVVMTDDQVVVTFAVRPLGGDQNCQGNPEQLVLIDLPAPLGERTIVDGLATGLDLADFLD